MKNVTFSNWDNRPNESENTDCAFIKADGKWSFKQDKSCFPSLILCTVCTFDTFPVLTLNGLCDSLDVDWNYYISLDNSNKIKLYEGYKTYNIIEIGNQWAIKPKTEKKVKFDINRQSENVDSYPVGRSMWNTLAPICDINEKEQRSMTFSKCEFGSEFTCDSGRCIDLSKRCDYVPDCPDKSDEFGCKLILRPETYREVQPPEPMNRSEALPIQTQIEILTIDSIDTINMVVGITINIRLYWKDSRLKFSNLIIGGKNIVQPGTVDGLWIPLDFLIFENSIIGEIKKDNSYEVRVDALDKPLPTETRHSVQNRLFSGEKNALYINERYKLTYRCSFFLRTFPFDQQSCPFMLQMKSDKITTISFTKFTPPVLYVGSKVVGQFRIKNITVSTKTDFRRTGFNLTLMMERVYTDQLITAFFPTALLWILAYGTLFITLDDFSDRIMVSVTALLVLAALLSSINSSLPDTSYFKYIDLWFMFYTTKIFLITVFHIYLGTIEDSPNLIMPSTASDSHTRMNMGTRTKTKRRSKKVQVNNVAKLIVPIIWILFNAIYFYLQTIDN